MAESGIEIGRFTDGTSVRWGLLASTIVGTVVYAWIQGVIDWIQRVPGGAVRAIDRLGTWVGEQVVGGILYALESSLRLSGLNLRSSFSRGLMSWLGPFAAPVAVIVAMLLFWGLMEIIDTSASIVRDS